MMNRKSYQRPTTDVVKVQATGVICQSVTRLGGPLQYGGAGGDKEANSRSFDGWEDDDE